MYKNLCYAIIGEGFVVKNTIYALSKLSPSSVLALSIEKKEVADGDLQFGCSLRSQIDVPFMIPMDHGGGCAETSHFVHLGGDNFCLVRSCKFWDSAGYQPIDVTYMKLVGEDKMLVTNMLSHRLRTPKDQRHGQFHVEFCFSQPECKTTTASKQDETAFFFDPYDGFVSKQEDKTDLNDVEVEAEATSQKKTPVSSAEEEGDSVIVKLPLDATIGQLVDELKKFGPIKRNGIRVNNKSDDTVVRFLCDRPRKKKKITSIYDTKWLHFMLHLTNSSFF